ncbi:MAG: class I SAM-dependent methyltransferase, partial [Acetobacteraceae bacterium]|nr:class I SAM-dependent methyltransferase [Acetobacteraceae bacterium]
VASEFPFRRVVGVEINEELATTARRNAALIGRQFPERPSIEVIHADASTYALPPEPFVLFLYQPFEVPVMRKALERVEKSLADAPRPAFVIYLHPALGRVFDRSKALERVAEGRLPLAPEEVPYSYGGRGGYEQYAIWRTTSPRPTVRAILDETPPSSP